MFRSIAFFLLFLLTGDVTAAALEAQPSAIKYEFLPNKPVIMTNSTSKNIQMWCEMHVDSYADNTFYIKQLRGRGEVNGTTLNTGNSMNISVKQLQTMQIVINANSQIQFTSLSSYVISAICH
ncbi:hypothetical protein [Legionella israelensis]|uniref:Uncharacterized protein n=1 Tax=Legionella israelensis TaxID=454 RepID=A0A0W0VEK4_9GAMM|nr:hypothetical protein [Legionella israelensis]KTD18520.1 hypothetical protein Lisr_2149 [Legionella israelensis]QBS10450.1 hypothetical protein E4T55_11635 [Legionella israelensis]SCY47775.1 hypothetical protein SAMN02746069_02593 [Legionella israelensis DSM 19235]STX60074.1 Uncharacterised protein [Legionella israelensis]